MPRAAQFPPPINHHKPSKQARVRWRGKDYYLGPWGSEEAKAAYARLLPQLAGAPTAAAMPKTLTIAEMVRRFLEHASQAYTAAGRETEQYAATVKPLVALFGVRQAGEFRAAELSKLRDAMASGSWLNADEKARYAARGYASDWSVGVVNRRLSRVRKIFRWAECEGLVPPGTWEHLRVVSGLRKGDARARTMPDQQTVSLETAQAVARLATPAVRAMLEIQGLTGMRSCEVRMMRTADIDRTSDDGVWVYSPRDHKNKWRGQPRAVTLGPECQRLLAFWLRDDAPELYLFRPQGGRTELFTASAYGKAVADAGRRAGVKIRPYGTRHGAKRRVTRAMGADAARAMLGQKSIEATSHYGGLDLEHAKEVAKKMA